MEGLFFTTDFKFNENLLCYLYMLAVAIEIIRKDSSRREVCWIWGVM